MPYTTHAAMRIGTGLVLAVTIAACSAPTASSPSASGGASSQAAPTSTTAPTDGVEPSAAAEATPTASVAVPSLGANTPLVDILPADLGGAATQKLAVVGSDLSAFDASVAIIFESILTILGADGADMTVGIASNDRASVIAIRVKGKSAKEIGDAMIAGRALNATTTKDELDLGGKHVIKVTTTTAPLPFYVYGTSDVSFTVAGANETIVTEALSRLP